MAKFLSLTLKIIVTLPVVAFLFFVTIENREQRFDFIWSPLRPAAAVSVPALIFGGLVLGFIWGSLILWSNTLEMRAERRNLKKRAAALENQLLLQKTEYDRLVNAKAASSAVDPAASPPPSLTPRIASPEII